MAALPDWCEPLYDAAQMRAVDRWAIEQRGVPSLDLMERAGEGVARAVERLAPNGPVAVVCGKGNNGGDGLVVARLLRQAGREVTVVLSGSAEAVTDELTPDAGANLARLPGAAPVGLEEPAARSAIARAAVVVDALLGTGFQGEPRGAVAQAIALIASSPARVVSVDVPSGADASTGVVAGEAVRADLTVTFHAAKVGLWVSPGKRHAGEVVTIDIGIPRGAPGAIDVGLIGADVLGGLPRRHAGSTKFTGGHVVVVGGSAGLMGAPAMACLAAMRAGAGYVTACVPESQRQVLDAQLMEAMTRGLPDASGALTAEAMEPAEQALARAGSLALGPGLGRDPGSRRLARELAQRAQLPAVIDADGLNAHAGRLGELAARTAPTVLTPHAGELGRLLERDSEQVERERLASAREAAEMAGAVVVLKGDDTIVAEPGGLVAVSPGGCAALATAGTGDVLTGVVAALLAQGLDVFTAAAAAVQLHAEAGRIAARKQGSPEGVIATDVIAALPRARQA